MVRRSVPARLERSAEIDGRWTVRFVGPLGAGAGLAADVVADVARLTFRRARRTRSNRLDAAAPRVAEIVSIDWPTRPRGAARASAPRDREWLVVWPEVATQGDLRIAVPEDLIVVASATSGALERRQATLPPAGASSRRTQALETTAAALGRLARRLPISADVWLQALKLHVPSRVRAAAEARFLAGYAEGESAADAPAACS